MNCDTCDVLLVEDEFLIALDVKMRLEAAGYTIRGPAASVEEGMALLDKGLVCAAILDINIQGSSSFPIAERLADEAIPFMFLSGNDSFRPHERFADRTVLTKPIDYDKVLQELAGIHGG